MTRFKVKNLKMKSDLTKKTFVEAPFAGKVKFFADKNKKNIIIVQKESIGKGWYQFTVGDKKFKSRNVSAHFEELERMYPKYEEVSLFSELSYHSAKGQGTAGKITNYGTQDFNLDFSYYSPLTSFNLEQPVKSESKVNFGRVVNKVRLFNWDYIVLDWRPDGDSTKLFVKHIRSSPFTKAGNDKVLFKSKEFDLKDKDKAIKLFRQEVDEFKRMRKVK